MKQPQGFEVEDKSNFVCHLNKALYGLHQSGREWFHEIHKTLEDLKFKKLDWVNCVYIYENNIVLLLYVDDIVLFGRSKEHIDLVISKLKNKFDLKILGKTRNLLGVEFEESNSNLFIHQTNYIRKVCSMFEKFKIPISSLPMAQGVVLSKLQCPESEREKREMARFPYRNLIGCLSFIASRTRPDLTHSLNILSQFQSNPGKVHWHHLLKLLGYLQYTMNYQLSLSKVPDLQVNCYADADFASNRDDRISLGGYILFLGGAPILWRTSKQKSVALSTMEAEFMALTDAAKELVWIIRILQETFELQIIKHNVVSTLYCDNESAINFSKSSIENRRTKHIHVRYHFLRDLISEGLFYLKYVNTKNNLADLFTKPQSKVNLKTFCDKIFIVC